MNDQSKALAGSACQSVHSPQFPCPICGSISDICFKPSRPAAPPDHDPLDRRLADEPYFALLARDHLSALFVSLYAASRARNYLLGDAIWANIKAVQQAAVPEPHKDKSHAWSAYSKATEMNIWRLSHMRAERASGKVNATGAELREDEPT